MTAKRLAKHVRLETPRLSLHFPQATMAPAITDYFCRNKAFFKPWVPLTRNSFYTLDFQQEKILQECQQIANKQLVKFWVCERDDQAGEYVLGHLAFSNLVWGAFRSCFLGYSIDQHHNGKGYASEALTAAVAFMFGRLKWHRIEANIMPRNQASIRVVEKLGFECEGSSPKYLKINGVWEDHLHYVIRNSALE